MNVYVVESNCAYEGCGLEGVFSTRENAERFKARYHETYNIQITEVLVDDDRVDIRRPCLPDAG